MGRGGGGGGQGQRRTVSRGERIVQSIKIGERRVKMLSEAEGTVRRRMKQ